VQLRQAAATAREALLALAAKRLKVPAAELTLVEGNVRNADGAATIGIGDLVGDRAFGIKMNPNAPLRDPASYTIVGQSLPRPDIPAKVTGRHVYMHDFALPNMLHGRVVRPPAVGAKLLELDAGSIKHIPGARVVRIQDFRRRMGGSEGRP
jgi:CO/xanthine dehydrogenase Mo-binding subunit